MATPYYATDGPVVVQGQVVGGVPATTYNNDHSDGVFKGERQPKRCNDAFFGILFYAHLAAMVWVAVTYTPQMYSSVASEYGGGRQLDENQQEYDGNSSIGMEINEVYMIIGISGVVGFIMSSLALSFMMSFASALIKVALWFNIILSFAMAIMALVGGVIPVAIICFIGFALTACYAYAVWSRIPFAASNLVTAITSVRANIGVSFFAYLNLFLTFGWTLWWSLAFVATNYVINGCDAQGECDTSLNMGIVFGFLISYFWVIQVLKNVVHVTVAGTVGTWWFAPREASSCCSKAVSDSWFRSMTTSFGSICFGSLIVAIIQAAKEILHQMREQGDGILMCCAECLLGCIESLVEYFNQWAL